MQIIKSEKHEKIIFEGLSFRRYPDSKRRSDRVYFKASLPQGKNKYLHVAIYEKYKGEIPEGSHIHHIDGNTFNNSIDNLQCLNSIEHISNHYAEYYKNNKRKIQKHLAEISPLTVVWHRSQEGREWHRRHAKNSFKYEKEKYKCLQCEKEYIAVTTWQNKFCSNNCKSAYRRKMGFDNITKICSICNKEFTVNKYYKTKTCSRRCARSLQFRNRK